MEVLVRGDRRETLVNIKTPYGQLFRTGDASEAAGFASRKESRGQQRSGPRLQRTQLASGARAANEKPSLPHSMRTTARKHVNDGFTGLDKPPDEAYVRVHQLLKSKEPVATYEATPDGETNTGQASQDMLF